VKKLIVASFGYPFTEFKFDKCYDNKSDGCGYVYEEKFSLLNNGFSGGLSTPINELFKID
jgi:hypothetical protein